MVTAEKAVEGESGETTGNRGQRGDSVTLTSRRHAERFRDRVRRERQPDIAPPGTRTPNPRIKSPAYVVFMGPTWHRPSHVPVLIQRLGPLGANR